MGRFYARPYRIFIAGIILLIILFLTVGLPGSSSSLHLDAPRITSTRSESLENVSNRTLGFQKIFVISLPYRTDQRDEMILAASLTGIDIEFVDGVSEVYGKALPVGAAESLSSEGAKNNWRAHLNAINKIVAQNLTSALVLEGDVDWDIRIKSQLRAFAQASRLLVQPLAGTADRHLDPTFPRPSRGQGPQDFPVDGPTLGRVTEPTGSPYGDTSRWDLLWLGHCGAFFPPGPDASTSPLGRAVISDDETVPELQHLNTQFGGRELLERYQDHTRVVSRTHDMTCLLAYGVTQAGARRILYEVGIREVTGTTDMMFRSVCQGRDLPPAATCLTVQPQLFQHHRPAGPKSRLSDIDDMGEGWNERAFTRNVRWSTRLNFAKLLAGETDYIDLFEDNTQSPPWLEP